MSFQGLNESQRLAIDYARREVVSGRRVNLRCLQTLLEVIADHELCELCFDCQQGEHIVHRTTTRCCVEIGSCVCQEKP